MAKKISSPPYSLPPAGAEPFAAQWLSWFREVHVALSNLLVAQPTTLLFDGNVTSANYGTSFTIFVPRQATLIVTGSFVQNQTGSGQTWQSLLAVDSTTIYDSGPGQAYQASVSLAGQVSVAAGTHTIGFTWFQSSTTYALKHILLSCVASLG